METITAKNRNTRIFRIPFWPCSWLFIVALFVPISLKGQVWQTLVEDQGEGSFFRGSHPVAKDHDGIVVTGNISDNQGLFLTKVDTSGNQVWRNTYSDSSSIQWAYDIAKTLDGGFAIIGVSDLEDEKGDIYLIKTDPDGQMLWSKYYDLKAVDYGRSLVATSDGGLLLAGYTSGIYDQIPVPAEVLDIVLIKVDVDGVVQWTQQFDAGFMSQEGQRDIIRTSDLGYLVLGWTVSPTAGFIPYLIKLDESGLVAWEKTVQFEEFTSFFPESILESSDGGYVISGFSKDIESNFETELALSKLDSEGNVLWRSSHDFLPETFEWLNDAEETLDGGFIACGFVTEPIGGGFSESLGYLAKYDGAGNLLCEKVFEDITELVGFVSLNDGDQLIAGVTHDMTSNADTYVMRWPEEYCPLTPNPVAETTNFPTLKVFPQPMTTHAVFELELTGLSRGVFSLFDLTGKQVFHEAFEGWRYLLERDKLPAGEYLYRIEISGEYMSGKLLIVD